MRKRLAAPRNAMRTALRTAAVATFAACVPAWAGPPISALLEPPPPEHVVVPPGVLRVCADPNNMPFSNERGEGFENAIARIVGEELHRRVEYTWWPQRRGFIRKTLREGLCDVVIGVPANYGLTDNTRPYYRSTYVFVARAAPAPPIASIDDPRLRELRIGATVVGDDYVNPPPVMALGTRGMGANVRGYSVYGDYSKPDPPRAVVDAVARGDVDIAVAWGPLAGYFASREPVPLALTPVAPLADLPRLAMTCAIAMGVRHGDSALKAELDRAIARHRRDIEAVLVRYGVPLVRGHDDERRGG